MRRLGQRDAKGTTTGIIQKPSINLVLHDNGKFQTITPKDFFSFNQ